MRLIDLIPRWVSVEGRHGMGISFECPCCFRTRLVAWFANPIDGLMPSGDTTQLWQRQGDTFDSLTLTPSISASAHGHWHGTVVNGDVSP